MITEACIDLRREIQAEIQQRILRTQPQSPDSSLRLPQIRKLGHELNGGQNRLLAIDRIQFKEPQTLQADRRAATRMIEPRDFHGSDDEEIMLRRKRERQSESNLEAAVLPHVQSMKQLGSMLDSDSAHSVSVTLQNVKNEDRAIVDESMASAESRPAKGFEPGGHKETDSKISGSVKKPKNVLRIKRDDIEFHPAGPLHPASPQSYSVFTSWQQARSNPNGIMASWRIEP